MSTSVITADNLHESIQQHEIVLVDFWADWCAPCRRFRPIVEAASETHPDILFGTVDTETERELAAGFQITSIPTLVALRDGVVLFSQPGALSADRLDHLIGQLRAVDMAAVHAEIAGEQR